MCQHLMFPISPWRTHCFGHRRERAAIPLITSQSISPSCAFLLISVPLAHPVKYIFFSVVHHDFLSYLLLILLRESIQSVRKSGKLFTNKNNKFIWSCWICDRKKKMFLSSSGIFCSFETTASVTEQLCLSQNSHSTLFWLSPLSMLVITSVMPGSCCTFSHCRSPWLHQHR